MNFPLEVYVKHVQDLKKVQIDRDDPMYSLSLLDLLKSIDPMLDSHTMVFTATCALAGSQDWSDVLKLFNCFSPKAIERDQSSQKIRYAVLDASKELNPLSLNTKYLPFLCNQWIDDFSLDCEKFPTSGEQKYDWKTLKDFVNKILDSGKGNECWENAFQNVFASDCHKELLGEIHQQRKWKDYQSYSLAITSTYLLLTLFTDRLNPEFKKKCDHELAEQAASNQNVSRSICGGGQKS